LLSVVLDRIEDGEIAVLLPEGQGDLILCPVKALPEGCRPGMWLRVEVEQGKVVHAELDPARTAESAARIKAKLDLLRRRRRASP